MLMMNSQVSQAKGNNGKVGVKQEKTMVGKKHPVAKSKRGGEQTTNVNYNAASNRRLEGKEKAIERRLEGKQKAIERRLEGKEKAIQRRSENAGNVGHRGHGRHKRHLNDLDVQQRHTNRGDIINSQTSEVNNLKQEKNKRYINQNGTRNKPARATK